MDAFGHVNHANVVTLLEESRMPLLFDETTRSGFVGLRNGIVVAKVWVEYQAPIIVDGKSVLVEISLADLKSASFTLGYCVHNGPSAGDPVAVTAETVLAPYDLAGGRPRRLSAPERDFLRARLVGDQDG